jgi:hypothetical protein
MSIDKQSHGDLDATGKGEMLTGGTAIKGSGVYVAVERVADTLHGGSGTFLLQHSGVMMTFMVPVRPVSWPVSESATRVMVIPTGAPRLLRREVEGSWQD